MKNHDAFAVSGTSPTQKSDSPAAPSSNSPTAIESRIDPVRLARILRQRLETRHPLGRSRWGIGGDFYSRSDYRNATCMWAGMNSRIHYFWCWYWRDRRGLLLLPHVCGGARLIFELPVLLLVVYAEYRWFLALPKEGQVFILAVFENPFVAVALLLVLAHEVGVRYLRDQLTAKPDYLWRLALLLPGRAIRLYSQQYGTERVARGLRGIRFVAIAFGAVGVFLARSGRFGG